MSAKISPEIKNYITAATKKHDVSEEIVLDILSNYPKINHKDYEPAFVVEKKLGLKRSFFSSAYTKQTSIKAQLDKYYNHIYVKLDDDIKQLLDQGHVCQVIKQCDIKLYKTTIRFTKNTLLGFY